MGDRCAAMRTLSRCVLFALHPLSAVVRPDRYCEFDEEPPYPVIRVGNSEVSVRDLVCSAAATLCSGPFGPSFFTQKSSEEPKPSCPAGGSMPAGNYCPRTHECPAEMKCPASSEPSSDPDSEARAHKVQELLIAAQIAAQVGDTEAACAYYRTVCELCPGTCCAWEAAEHIRSLQAATDDSAEEKQEEQNVCPSVKEKEAATADPDNALEDRLKQPVTIEYTNRPLPQVLEQLRSRYKINIFVDNLSLQKSGICLDQPVTIKLGNVSLRSALNLMVDQLDLTARVKEGVVVITTPLAARDALVPKVYAVADLIKGKKRKPRKAEMAQEAEKLIELIQTTITPKWWAPRGGPGTIVYFPRKGALVISQDEQTHEQIADLLTALRKKEAEKDCPEGDTETSEYNGPVIAAYDISDLMSRPGMSGEEDPAGPSRDEIDRGTRLMSRIKETVAPEKWAAGSDSLEYYPETRMLVVRQPQEVQDRVVQFLTDLRESDVKQTGAEEPAKNAQGQLVETAYGVSDLLTTYGVDWDRKTDRLTIVKKTEDPARLMRLMQDGIVPESWAGNGGKGTIRYEPKGEQLLIQQTAEVQQAIRDFLDARRREIELHQRGCERHLKGCKAEPKTQQPPAPVCSAFQCAGAAALFEALASDPPSTIAEDYGSPFCLCNPPPGAKLHDNVSQLLDSCHKALKEGRLAEAEMLASRALCLDPMRVKADPMVHKMLVLNQFLSRAVTMQPLLPVIDFNIVQAYNEILGLAPPRLFIEIHEAGGTEECEDNAQSEAMPRLFLDQDKTDPARPSVCFDIDQAKGRVRCQLQFGFGTLCFVRDEDGHSSIELALPPEDR